MGDDWDEMKLQAGALMKEINVFIESQERLLPLFVLHEVRIQREMTVCSPEEASHSKSSMLVS